MALPTAPHDFFSSLAGKYTSNNQLSCVLKPDAQVDEHRLIRALHRLLVYQPVLECRFSTTENKPVWVKQADFADSCIFNVFETDQPDSELQRFIVTPFDNENDCQVKVGVFRNQSDTICVKVNHACSDARGLIQLVSLLTQLYNAENVASEFLPVTDRSYDRFLHTPENEQLLNQLSSGSAPVPAIRLPVSPGKSKDQQFISRHLDENQFCLLKEYTRKRGVSVNDVLLTSYIRALAVIAELPEKKLSVNLTVDLRRYLPETATNAICNFSGGEFVTVYADLKDSFDQTLAQVRQVTQRLKSDHFGLRSAFLAERLGTRTWKDASDFFKLRREEALRSGLSIPYFSNIGILSESTIHLGTAEVKECYLIGQALFAPGLIVVAGTYRNRLTISANFYGSEFSPLVMEQLLDRMVYKELLKNCS
jgi:NRPS condensation-like uncharacterized protein